MMNDLAALHAVARGRVQGVNYRAFISRNAAALGLTGYVRNLPDNSVEITAEGNKKQLQTLIELLEKGPPAARVDNLELTWTGYTGQYRDFSVTG
jgi:acylphosphatase